MGDSLLHRLQSLTGPDREVDAEIALAVGWTHQKMTGDGRPYWRKPGETQWFVREDSGPPRYTESLDAALTLIPKYEGTNLGIWIKLNETGGSHGSGKSFWHAELNGVERIPGSAADDIKDLHYWGMHTSPAIALLIAWAKMMGSDPALSTQETEEG